MSGLPQATKDLAKAHFFAGLTHDDIAAKVGVSSNTIRSWISRGKWKSERKGMQMRVSAKVESKMLPCISNETEEAILAHRERIIKLTRRQMDKLEQSESVKSADLQAESISLKNIDDIARRNLGMVDQTSANAQPGSFHLHLSSDKMQRKAQVVEGPIDIE